MYAGFVTATKTPLASLVVLQKQYIALRYSGGDKWKKIGTGFTTVIDYANRFIEAEKEKAYAGQEDYTALFPKADAVGKATSELADELVELAKKYNDAHKDPRSWLAASKKAEKARADLTALIMVAAKKLSTAAKAVKAARTDPISTDEQEQFVKDRKGFAKLAKDAAARFKGYLDQEKRFLAQGAPALTQAKALAATLARELEQFNSNPIFMKSRGSMPEWDERVPDATVKRMDKEAADAFEAGMRSAAQMSQYQDEIDGIIQELTGLAEEAEYAAINAEQCMTKLTEMRGTLGDLLTDRVKKMAGFNWGTVSAALTKLADGYARNPAFKVAYISKRNEIADRIVAAKVAVGNYTALKKRADKVPTPNAAVTQAKTELVRDIDSALALPTAYAAAQNNFEALVRLLNPKVGEQ